MKAIWNNTTIAESEHTELVEGNHYFPPESIHKEFFIETNHSTICPWKGKASYYTIQVNNEINENAAWYYPAPKDAASHIKDHVAFWKGVNILES